MFLSDNGASAEVVEIGDGPIGSMSRWASLKEDWANVANTPFRFYKNTSYEGGTATPFIVHWPQVIREGGKTNHVPLHFIDIMPTLIEVSGSKYPALYKGNKVYPLEGKSILPLFKGESIERAEPIYFDWRKGSAIRTDQWKLVRADDTADSWELYDMTTDRTETKNLIEAQPEVAKTMQLKWEQWAERVGVK